MSKVYVVEVPARRSPSGKVLGLRDISDAYRFGQVITLLPSNDEDTKPFDFIKACNDILRGLADFKPENDYLMAGMGHPLALAVAVAEVARCGEGQFSLLHWDARRRKYSPVFVDMTKSPEDMQEKRA